MRVTCSSNLGQCDEEALITGMRRLRIEPIITPVLIRGVYEGDSHRIGTSLVELFAAQDNHDIVVDYQRTDK